MATTTSKSEALRRTRLLTGPGRDNGGIFRHTVVPRRMYLLVVAPQHPRAFSVHNLHKLTVGSSIPCCSKNKSLSFQQSRRVFTVFCSVSVQYLCLQLSFVGAAGRSRAGGRRAVHDDSLGTVVRRRQDSSPHIHPSFGDLPLSVHGCAPFKKLDPPPTHSQSRWPPPFVRRLPFGALSVSRRLPPRNLKLKPKDPFGSREIEIFFKEQYGGRTRRNISRRHRGPRRT